MSCVSARSRFYFESDRPIAHVARDLGIHKEALRQWVRQAEADRGRRRDLLTSDEREELKRLRKENAELRRANAILKDASVYFATELDPTGEGDPLRGGAAGRLRGRADLPCAGRAASARTTRAGPGSRPAARSPTASCWARSRLPARLPARLRRPQDLARAAPARRRRRPRPGRPRDAQHGIAGKLRGRKHRTTIPDEAAVERARDLLQRDFAATRPNEKWVCDITYLRTWNGFVYLAFVLDCYSRMIVGWQLAAHMRTELVLDALEMANGLRRPARADRAKHRGGYQQRQQPNGGRHLTKPPTNPGGVTSPASSIRAGEASRR